MVSVAVINKFFLKFKIMYQMVIAIFVYTLLVPVNNEPTGRQFRAGIRYSRGEKQTGWRE